MALKHNIFKHLRDTYQHKGVQ